MTMQKGLKEGINYQKRGMPLHHVGLGNPMETVV